MITLSPAPSTGFLSSAACLLLMPEGAFATDVLGAASLGGAFVGMSTPTTVRRVVSVHR